MTKQVRIDPRETITKHIIAQLENGVMPWAKPWNSTESDTSFMPINFAGKPYNGINVLILWAAQAQFGYKSNRWMTFKQLAPLGGNVKGQKSTQIVYMNKVSKTDKETGENKSFFIAKSFYVFNTDQITGLPEKYYIAKKPLIENFNSESRNVEIDSLIENTGANFRHGGNRACYIPSIDAINMPLFESFNNAFGYYSTFMHEFGHWTGSEKRLNRKFGKRFGDKDYAIEELVAELTSAFTCHFLGLSPEPRQDHVNYIGSWLKGLKNDVGFIAHAATKASQATECILDAMGVKFLLSAEEDLTETEENSQMIA